MNARRRLTTAEEVINDLKPIVEEFELLTLRKSNECSVLEIGFGARPFRAFALQLYFQTVTAVDLDVPIFSIKDVPRALKTNGLLRTVKGVIRALVFDRNQWSFFHRGMTNIWSIYSPSRTILEVANAASEEFWEGRPGPYDLILSCDVFEHIERSDLEIVIKNMKGALKENGICIIRPCIYTGITGGHDPDWYGHRVKENKTDRAWRHLLDKNFSVDTYLNKLTRREFRELFTRHGFEIVKDISIDPDLGREYLTSNLREQLVSWDDYELFSNNVHFVIK